MDSVNTTSDVPKDVDWDDGGDVLGRLATTELRTLHSDGSGEAAIGMSTLTPEPAFQGVSSSPMTRTPFDRDDDEGSGIRQSRGFADHQGARRAYGVEDHDAVREASFARSERIKKRDALEKEAKEKTLREAKAEWARLHKKWEDAKQKKQEEASRRQREIIIERDAVIERMERNAASGQPDWKCVWSLVESNSVKAGGVPGGSSTVARTSPKGTAVADAEWQTRKSRTRMKEVILGCSTDIDAAAAGAVVAAQSTNEKTSALR